MIFQQVNLNNVAASQEFMKICKEHSGCKNCPLLDKDIEIQGTMTRCETGRAKGVSNEEK